MYLSLRKNSINSHQLYRHISPMNLIKLIMYLIVKQWLDS